MLTHKEATLTLAHRMSIKQHIMRLDPLALTALVAIINGILPALILSLDSSSIMDAFFSGFGQSFIIWFSLWVALHLYLADKTPYKVSEQRPNWQYLLAFTLSVSLIFPFALSSWLCATLAAFIWRANMSKEERRSGRGYAALLIIALAIREPCTQFFLQVTAEQVLALDAQLAFFLLQLFVEGVSLQNNIIVNEQGANLIILTGCSAFGNLSLALLLYLSFKLYWFHTLDRKDGYRVLLLVFLVLLSNSSRLALMTLSHDSYAFIHDGLGADLFDTLVLMLPLLILLLPTFIGRKI